MPDALPTAPALAAPPAAVLDTQVVLDELIFGNPTAGPVFAAVRAGRLRWLVAPAMLAEYTHMVLHPSLARWPADRHGALVALDKLGTLVPAPAASDPRLLCSDPDDQVFIDTALAQRARWLLTRDRALLKLARRARERGLEILRPERWSGG